MMINPAAAQDSAAILTRLDALERQNRRLKVAGGVAAACIALVAALGFRPAGDRLVADELNAGLIKARTIVVETEKGTVRIDEKGITITAPGQANPRKTTVADHEARIEIGMDYQWSQDNGLLPTPRVAVGRIGHDASNNLLTRISILSPEGVHSGQWHTNNPSHDGKTDRDLIDDLKKK